MVIGFAHGTKSRSLINREEDQVILQKEWNELED